MVVPSLTALLPYTSWQDRCDIIPSLGSMLDDHFLEQLVLIFSPSSFLTALNLVLLLQAHVLIKIFLNPISRWILHFFFALWAMLWWLPLVRQILVLINFVIFWRTCIIWLFVDITAIFSLIWRNRCLSLYLIHIQAFIRTVVEILQF